MSLYNMPPGCMDASDVDYYNRINPPQQCPGCKLAEYECECCKQCGANPDQAHEEWCGTEADPEEVDCCDHGTPFEDDCAECEAYAE